MPASAQSVTLEPWEISIIDHYVPELSMERLVRGFLKDQFTPHLESSQQRLASIGQEIDDIENHAQRTHAATRLNTLNAWQTRVRKLLPVVLTVLSGVQALSKEEPPADII